MMTVTWVGLGAIGAVTLAILMVGYAVWARVNAYQGVSGSESDASGGFTPERYEPMIRLLAEDDMNFLRQQSGCHPQIAAQWNRARQRILRMYLKDLAADFGRLHAEARLVLAEAPEQYSDLIGVLVRQQLTFLKAMTVFELRLALSRLGLGRIDARRLVAVVQSMQVEISQRIAPASA